MHEDFPTTEYLQTKSWFSDSLFQSIQIIRFRHCHCQDMATGKFMPYPQLLKKFKNDMFMRLTCVIYLISQDECPFSEKRRTLRFIKELAPDMTFNDNAMQRIYSFVFRHFPMLLVYLRYLYGKIIENYIRPTYRQFIHQKESNDMY